MSKSTQEKIAEQQRMSSLVFIRKLSQQQDFELGLIEREPLVFAHWLSMILISAPEVKVTFKTHFNIATAQTLAATVHKGPEGSLSLDKATDFFREFCNLLGGDVKYALLESKINASTSLPILTKGFDELYFSRTPGSYRAAWKLQSPKIHFFCSTQIELGKEFGFKGTSGAYEKQKGEVEFF